MSQIKMGHNEDKSVLKKEENEKPSAAIKKYSDLQRLKLEKLMKHIEKPIVIPDRPKEKNNAHVPEFIRNVMGSSAGAGSGEFHVYRHLRRKEYARQKYIQLKSEKEILDEAYKQKLKENAKIADERTAKKRAKRLKKKEKMKLRKLHSKTENKESISSIVEDKVNENENEEDNSSSDNSVNEFKNNEKK